MFIRTQTCARIKTLAWAHTQVCYTHTYTLLSLSPPPLSLSPCLPLLLPPSPCQVISMARRDPT